jgi:hypothetical protein
MQNIIGLIASIAIAALLIWSGFRACRVRNRFLKWGGLGLAAELAMTVSSVSALTIAGIRWLLQRVPFKNRHADRR